MASRLGVDVGGTFTDLVYYDDATGEVRVAKGSTTPGVPDDGVAHVVSEAVSRESLSEAAFFLHGTTVGINALLERKGAVVGLLTTAGFRDVLEMRRGDRDRMYDMLWAPPPPLVPRRLRIPIRERVRADGVLETSLDEEAVREAVSGFQREGVTSVAIVFINAYANPVHELRAQDVLRAAGFDGEISLSHQVSGEFREFERSSTTVIDAYVRPHVSQYLRRLTDKLSANGFSGDCLITRSGGGAMSFVEAEARPFETIMSGPVAGAVGAGELCRRLGIARAITADVGGTSFDTCLIVDGAPQVKYEGKVAGMPIQTPWVDVRSIGAGGGSIARVDEGGLLRVGPQSAGALPGPACYGRGGTEPTVTDAAAALGMLGFGELAGGVRLDIDTARAALEPLADTLDLDIDSVARGVVTIAASAMANAIRSVTIEQGEDPREASLLAFGGAGPLLATLLANELDIASVLVPNYAGNFSAWGLLGQDLTRTAAATSIATLDDQGLRRATGVLDQLYAQMIGRSAEQSRGNGGPIDSEVRGAALDLRYRGQEYTLTIDVPTDDGTLAADASTIADTFTRNYDRTFGHTLDEPVEIVAVRATARRPLPRRAIERVALDPAETEMREGTINAYSFSRGTRTSFNVVRRASLNIGDRLSGPAIILEPTTTTYLDAGFVLSLHETGTLFMTNQEGPSQ